MVIQFIYNQLAGDLLVTSVSTVVEYWEEAVLARFLLKTPFPIRTIFLSGVYTFEAHFPLTASIYSLLNKGFGSLKCS